jgi:serine/threonine protein phosphatase 1
MHSRVIAIGDIHGCAAALHAILEAIGPKSEDILIPLGDCIDRGPDSRHVIEQLLAVRHKCRLLPLIGNHEEMMLNFLDGKPQPDNWLEVGGAATLKSYGGAEAKTFSPPDKHIEFIRSWQDSFETDSHFFVHASYEPESRLSEQHTYTMRWHSLRDWIPEPHISGKTAIVGHTSMKDGEILNVGHLICIDTYCCGGGWLTALDSTTGQIWQADREGRLRSETQPLQPAQPS